MADWTPISRRLAELGAERLDVLAASIGGHEARHARLAATLADDPPAHATEGAFYLWTSDELRARLGDLPVIAGRAFTQADVDGDAKVALLGKTVVDNLFNGEDPIGQTIRIRKIPFTVIGTLSPKGQSAQGQDQDDLIVMPISTAKKKVIGGRQNNAGTVGQIMVQAREGKTQVALQEIAGLLRTMFDPRNSLAQQVSAQLQSHFGTKVYTTVIPRNVRLAEAPSFGAPAVSLDKACKGSQAYLQLAAEIIERQERKAREAA